MSTKTKTDKAKKPAVKVQDMKPKKDAKGGREPGWGNHNETFVCDEQS